MDVLFQVERIRVWMMLLSGLDVVIVVVRGDVSVKKLKLEGTNKCKGSQKLLESRCSPSYIHDMMSTLSKNNSVEKLAEIDLIGFGFLRLVPNWSVKQAIIVHLAESYQVKPRTFILDIGNIRLNAELIGKVFGIPSGGDPFPALDESNPSHVAIKNRFHRRSTTELRDLVYSCPMATESDRMEFRRYFILVVMKIFLCPTTQQVFSPWHIYPVLDVSDPRRFNWPLEILKWFDTAVERYKLKWNKTCEGCMFVMLGRLLTRHGGGDDIKSRSPQAARRKPGKKEPQNRRQKESVLPRNSKSIYNPHHTSETIAQPSSISSPDTATALPAALAIETPLKLPAYNPLLSLLQPLQRRAEPLRPSRLQTRNKSDAALPLHVGFPGAAETSWCTCVVR
ncbi:hypothetical protein AHAS_Ahas11G0039700 [Arachis hypogaea]